MTDLALPPGWTVEPLLTPDQAAVLALGDRLGYLKPSDEWTDLADPLPPALQDAATDLYRAGWLPQFEEKP